jgi:hypothetical protein
LPITTALRWALGRAPPASVRRPGSRDGISYAGGVGFRDDPHQVHVAELDLRPTERFVYDYDFTDGWRLDLCLEQILAAEAGRVYPRCTGGRRAAPPEASGGALAFLEQTQPHHVLARDRPCGRDSEPAPGSQRTSRGSASTATNSRPFSRCWVWTGSTGGQRTVPWQPSTRSGRGRHEDHRAGRAARRRRQRDRGSGGVHRATERPDARHRGPAAAGGQRPARRDAGHAGPAPGEHRAVRPDRVPGLRKPVPAQG